MTNSSPNSRLLEAAQTGLVPYPLLKEIAVQTSRAAPDLLDELAYFVALQYATDKMDFKEADTIMNALWAVCVTSDLLTDYDVLIPSITDEVYLAFDAGEYYRESDPAGTDPEVKYTKPMIEAFLEARHRQDVTAKGS